MGILASDQDQRRLLLRRRSSNLRNSLILSDSELKYIFIRDDIFAWIPGKIISKNKNRALVVIDLPSTNWHLTTHGAEDRSVLQTKDERLVNLPDYPDGELPLQAINEEIGNFYQRDMA